MNELELKLEKFGFVEIDETDFSSHNYSRECSGNRSDCCTRVCSKDENFVGTVNDWENFLEVEGGQVQY